MAIFDESHPRLKGFSDYHAREIAGHLGGFEEARRQALTRAIPKGALAVLAGGIAVVVFTMGSDLAVLPAIAAVMLVAWAIKGVTDAKRRLKAFLAEKVCAFLDLSYDLEAGGFPLQWFEDLKLVPDYDRSQVEDGISGSHQGARISLADVKLRKRRGSGKSKSWHTVFHGLLCAFSFPKRFRGTTVVTADRGALGNWFSALGRKGERVRLEDPRFEADFEVYASDQVEARYLLTPGFMERVMALAGKVGKRRLRLAFDGDHLLVAIDFRRNSFEAGSLFGSAGDPERVSQLVEELTRIFQIVDTLGLTLKTRI